MLAKITAKNQRTLPKSITKALEGSGAVRFRVESDTPATTTGWVPVHAAAEDKQLEHYPDEGIAEIEHARLGVKVPRRCVD